MTVYKKLNDARTILHAQPLRKTGKNTFAGYEYFELSDFLIPSLHAFEAVGLCAVISFTSDVATMKIVDVETGETIEITSPMGSAALKGCHEVQNIGAVETYQRRYLWTTAMEIVERDALEATTGRDAPEKRSSGKATDAQMAELMTLIEITNSDVKRLCEHLKIKSLQDLTEDSANKAIAAVKTKVKK